MRRHRSGERLARCASRRARVRDATLAYVSALTLYRELDMERETERTPALLDALANA